MTSKKNEPCAVLVRPRIYIGDGIAIGPGKIDLLRAVGETRSIAAATRLLGIPYKRAWLLIDSLNVGFGRPVVDTATGGKGGGGASLTSLGQLAKAGLAASEVKPYAFGRIVLWSATADASKMTLASLTDPKITRIAIANPKHAPYGKRAEEALRAFGLWEKVEPKLVYCRATSAAISGQKLSS